MKNILTIDFDILMNQDIELYNCHIDNNYGIEDLMQYSKILEQCDFDHRLYAILTNYILNILFNAEKEQFYFITNHEEIIDLIDEDSNIFNIDHHHDLGYQRELKEEDINGIGCANWGYYGFKNKLIKNYIWIHDTNSQMIINEELFNRYNIYTINFDDLNLNEIDLSFDKIILCLSPNWIPPKFRDYFYLWRDIVNSYYKSKNIERITNENTRNSI